VRELLAAAQFAASFAAERVSLLALGLLELGEHDDLGDIEACAVVHLSFDPADGAVEDRWLAILADVQDDVMRFQ
jgi:hypothetical protein